MRLTESDDTPRDGNCCAVDSMNESVLQAVSQVDIIYSFYHIL